MKNRFSSILSFICAVMIMISAISAWAAAEETPATPSDLGPAEQETQEIILPIPEAESEKESGGLIIVEQVEEQEDEPADSVEVIITKSLSIGQSWNGKMSKKHFAILKLDVSYPCPVYMLVEGRDVWFTVEKSDHVSDNQTRIEIDPETEQRIYCWEAEAGSYLITLGPVEPNLMERAKVTFMDTRTYEAWDKLERENGHEQTKETETDNSNGTITEENNEESESPESVDEYMEPTEGAGEEYKTQVDEERIQEEDLAENPNDNSTDDLFNQERKVLISLTWDTEIPREGDVGHFRSEMIGYEDLHYTLQWQTSWDENVWTDYPGANEPELDVILTKELNGIFFRLMVYVEIDEEE